MKKTVICPYCGTKNQIDVKSVYNDARIVACDPIEGGCDKIFVADISVQVQITPKKVEGELEN